MTTDKPLCIIPARKGSKRLKGKNTALINGKPLVEYAIEAAVGSGVFGAIVVSSDDLTVLDIAQRNFNKGLVQPHKRPTNLATDSSQVRHVCKYLLTLYLCNGVFCVLLPCNPFRTGDDIRRAFALYKAKGANYVMSVVEAQPPPQLSLQCINGYLEPLFGYECVKQSQNLEKMCYHDGSILIANARVFLNEFEQNFYGSKVVPFYMGRTVDIDTQEDLDLARFLMRGDE